MAAPTTQATSRYCNGRSLGKDTKHYPKGRAADANVLNISSRLSLCSVFVMSLGLALLVALLVIVFDPLAPR
jgi:hypothetical protein